MATSSHRGHSIRVHDIHLGSVRSVCFFPDHSDRLATGSADTHVRIFNTSTGALIADFTDHTDEVNSVDVSNTCKFIISGGDDGSCKVWQVSNFALIHSFIPHESGMVYCARISKDETKCITCSWDHAIKIFGFPRAAEPLRVLRGHTGVVMSIAVDDKFSRIISASWDHTARVWDAETGLCERILMRHTGDCNAVAISADGSKAVTASDDRYCYLWDLQTGVVLRELSGHSEMLVCVSARIRGDSYIIATASWDGTCRVYDNFTDDTGRVVANFNGRKVASVHLSPSSTYLAAGSFDKTFFACDLFYDDRLRILALLKHKRLPKDVAMSIRSFLFWQ